MDLGFKGKTVIVTGGSKGIGSGISTVFAEEGANLIVNYHSDEKQAEEFVKGLRDKYGAQVYAVKGDVGEPEDVKRIFDFAEEKFGRQDVLINNAGCGQTDTMIWDITLDDWNYYLKSNVTGQFLMSQEFAKRIMAENKKGYIVQLLSKASLTTTTKGRACYVTNKAAEMGLMKQLAVDLTDKGIRVNGIMPGTVQNSKMNFTHGEKAARVKRCPTGKFGTPYEFGKLVAFLASEQNELAVGAVIDNTGGMMLGF